MKTLSVPILDNRETASLIFNTLACGVATSFCFGPLAGLCTMVTNVALSKINPIEKATTWFPLDSRVTKDIKDYWKNSSYRFTVQAGLGIIFRGLGYRPNQLAVTYLRNSLFSPWAAAYTIFSICVVAPIVEETIFRGFLQEKIRDIQCCVIGKKADSVFQRTLRAGLQAIAFSSQHYHPSQGLFNIVVLISTGISGYLFGIEKEKTRNHHLWRSTAMHAHVNSASTARTCLFGF
jgi:hypothetical protein